MKPTALAALALAPLAVVLTAVSLFGTPDPAENIRLTITNDQGGVTAVDGKCSQYGRDVVTFICETDDETRTLRAPAGTYVISPRPAKTGEPA